jgi:hypothetical protein
MTYSLSERELSLKEKSLQVSLMLLSAFAFEVGQTFASILIFQN